MQALRRHRNVGFGGVDVTLISESYDAALRAYHKHTGDYAGALDFPPTSVGDELVHTMIGGEQHIQERGRVVRTVAVV